MPSFPPTMCLGGWLHGDNHDGQQDRGTSEQSISNHPVTQPSHASQYTPQKTCPLKVIKRPALCLAAHFPTAKTWQRAQGPSPEEGIRKRWSLYTREYCSALEQNPSPKPPCSQRDGMQDVSPTINQESTDGHPCGFLHQGNACTGNQAGGGLIGGGGCRKAWDLWGKRCKCVHVQKQ